MSVTRHWSGGAGAYAVTLGVPITATQVTFSAGPAYNLPITGVTAAGFSSAANTVYCRDERVGVPNNFLLATVLLMIVALMRTVDLRKEL